MMYIKQESTMDGHPQQSSPRPSASSSTVHYSVTNENWRGKNDPTERRRIQNRLNQRAFRQRQRAGEPTKQYRPRSVSGDSASRQDDAQTSSEDDDDDQNDDDDSEDSGEDTYVGNASTSTATCLANTTTDSSSRYLWDELGQLINRNLMQAAHSNAQQLGISPSAVQTGTPIVTPRVSPSSVASALQTIKPQHEMAHDPIIDIIPHPRLRYNILRAIAARQLDAAKFSASIRASGVLENVNRQWQRGGLVVWDGPDQLSSWELSELFVRQWGILLHGCEDLLAATNAWRRKRGERLLPSSIPAAR